MRKKANILVVALVLLGAVSPAGAQSAGVLLEKGVFLQETKGDVDGAMKIYKQIVADAKANRKHVASAQYRLGTCYLGKKKFEQAEAAFKELIADFPNEAKLIAKAHRAIVQCRKRIMGPALARIVKEAVMTISMCAEHDPRAKAALESLEGLNEPAVIKAITPFLDAEMPNVRRAGIYVLWRGKFKSIDQAVAPLKKLCKHREGFTRGMAAIALGGRKVDSSFQVLCDMALKDENSYARRCAAYALGLLGRADARDVLSKALKDKDDHVRNNARAALEMLGQKGRPTVVKTTPAAYATDVATSVKQITVTFDQTMADKRWAWTGGGDSFPEMFGPPFYDKARKTCTLTVKLKPGKVYWVGINSESHHAFQTLAGRPAKPYVILFATADAKGKATTIPADLLARAKAINAKADKVTTGQARGPLPVGPAPWADGEQLYLNIKSPTGAQLGAAVSTMESDTVDGKKVWRMRARYLIANMLMHSNVVVDRDSALPISCRIAGDQIGDLRTTYSGNSIVWQTAKGQTKSSRTVGTDGGAIYDEEQIGDLLRRLPLTKGSKVALAGFSTQNGLVSRYDAEVVGRETVTVPAGKFDCHRIHMDMSIGGMKLQFKVWLTADRHRYPVKLDAHAMIMELRKIGTRAKDETKPVAFKDAKQGISLSAPAGWFFHATDADSGSLLHLLPPDMGIWALLASHEHSGDLSDSREAAEGDIEGLKKMFKDYTVRPKSWAAPTISGIAAASYVADYAQQGREMVEYRAYVCGKRMACWFVFRVVKDRFAANKATYDSIVKSLKVSDVPAAVKRPAEMLAARAWRLWGQGKFAEAEKLFKQAVEKDRTLADAWNGLGWAQLNQGKPKEARVSFEKCLILQPKHAAALNGLGWIAKGRGKRSEAIEYWQKAVVAVPATTAALNGLATTHFELKQYDRAAKYYEMWLKVEPNNADARAGLKRVKAAIKENSAS